MVSESKKRLIDANALKSEFEWLKSVVNESSKDEVMDVMQRIDNAPTVDAVEVVRCKDCKYLNSDANGLWCFRDYENNLTPEDFCSNGERKVPHV